MYNILGYFSPKSSFTAQTFLAFIFYVFQFIKFFSLRVSIVNKQNEKFLYDFTHNKFFFLPNEIFCEPV